jgi:hypothetical protein
MKNPRSGLRMDASEGIKVWDVMAGSGEVEAGTHPKRKEERRKRVRRRFMCQVSIFRFI